MGRRDLLRLAVGGLSASALPASAGPQRRSKSEFAAVVFDAFPIFDPRSVFALAEKLFPGKGAELSSIWRTRQFEYQWLRALSGHYADFWRATEDGLVFAAEMLRLDLNDDKRARLMQAYLGMKPWPDVVPALEALKQAGLRLAILSNMTAKMLNANISNAGLSGAFEQVLSTDETKTYKPDPCAYQMAVEELGLERHQILFAPFAGWDASGAKWFGYPTFWVNRLDLPVEQLGVTPDAVGRDLSDLARFAAAFS
jgi:2-haloacid dehalogenase